MPALGKSGLGLALATVVLAPHGSLATAADFAADFRPALLTAAGLSVLGALPALRIGRRTARTAPAPY